MVYLMFQSFPTQSQDTQFKMRICGLSLAIVLFVWLSPAHAAFPGNQNNTPTAKDKAQAARQAQRQYQGRVLKVDTMQTTYRVKILQKSGRVVSVEIKRAVYLTSPVKKVRPTRLKPRK